LFCTDVLEEEKNRFSSMLRGFRLATTICF
jgi:hypothetical protein